MDLFAIKSEQYHRGNLMFEHHFGGCCKNQTLIETAKTAHHGMPQRNPVPGDLVEDYTDWAYGEMPHSLTLRPVFYIQQCFQCGPHAYFDVTRDMMGPKQGMVEVDFPCMYGCYISGCLQADVHFQSQQGGQKVDGKMYHNTCFGVCYSTITVEFDQHPQKPQMTWKWFGPMDECCYSICMDVWVGWRGRNGTDPENVVAYDQSYILNQCDLCGLACAYCGRCNDNFCNASDYAPRFGRGVDVRRLVNGRYDWQMARRDLGKKIDLVKYSLKEGSAYIKYPIANAEDTCALYSARLYHDVKCCIPFVRWGNMAGKMGQEDDLAAVDVRYRGSDNQKFPSDSDHLIVLAGLIINGVWTFPSASQTGESASGGFIGTGFANNLGPVDNVRRGRILRKVEGAKGTRGQAAE